MYAVKRNSELRNDSLNSDGHQFHQYQQSKQLPLTANESNTEKITTYSVGNPGPSLVQANKCGGV
jgi:hypothetical protein